MTETPPDNLKQSPRRSSRERLAQLRAWLTERPEHDLPTLLESLHKVRQLFFEEMAERLAPAINDYLKGKPYASYEQKKDLAKWLNGELRALDLAIECPKTGMPATLVVNPGSDQNSHFQLNVSLPDGRRTKTCGMTQLPDLKFTNRDAGIPKESRWQERAAPPRPRSR